METYNLGTVTKAIYDARMPVLARTTLRDTIHTAIKPITLSVIIRRLLEANVLTKLERGKYLVNGAGVHEFAIANFLYQPSYVSFESALNYHGVLPQIAYEITSATTKKPVEKIVEDRCYRYNRIKKSLFWGYKKGDGFLVANAEKALLDLTYLASKGYGRIHPDDLVMERVSRKRMREYAGAYPRTEAFQKLLKEMGL